MYTKHEFIINYYRITEPNAEQMEFTYLLFINFLFVILFLATRKVSFFLLASNSTSNGYWYVNSQRNGINILFVISSLIFT